MKNLLLHIAQYLPKDVITGADGSVYLERYTFFGWHAEVDTFLVNPRRKLWNLRLHRFLRPDEDRELHDHPWAWAVSLILLGGYTEGRLRNDGTIQVNHLRPGQLNFFKGDTFHRVAGLLGESETWTLILTGPKTKSWSFRLSDGTLVPWRKFIEQRKNGSTVSPLWSKKAAKSSGQG